MYNQSIPAQEHTDRQTVFALNELIVATRGLAELLTTATSRLHEDLELSVPERSVLIALRRAGARTVPALARERKVSRQFIQMTVNGLLARELVESQPNPAHRRSRLIALTAAGTGLIREVMRREGAVLQALSADLTAPEIRQAVAVMAQMTSKLSIAAG